MKNVLAFLLLTSICGGTVAGDAKDLKALQDALSRIDGTLPGENLEDLAELSSQYVVRAPATFLQAQSDPRHCFGVNFLGVRYVDDRVAQTRELEARRAALESVTDPALASAKARCLRELAGS